MNPYEESQQKLLKLQAEAKEYKSQYSPKLEKLSGLKLRLDDIQREIADLEKALSSYNNVLQKYEQLRNVASIQLKGTLALYYEKRKEFESSKELEKEIRDKLSSYEQQLRFMATEVFVNRIYQIDTTNSLCYEIKSTTKTTPIMDKFYNSDSEFLILKEFQKYYSDSDCVHDYSFVVVRGIKGIEHYKLQPTMTELKMHNSVTRMQDIENCLDTIFKTPHSPGDKIPFDKPCLLGGQIYANQTGFGWEWEWGDLISEGTLYGEVTNFMIIGIIYNRFWDFNKK